MSGNPASVGLQGFSGKIPMIPSPTWSDLQSLVCFSFRVKLLLVCVVAFGSDILLD